MIWRVMQTEEDNTLRGLRNSSDHTKSRFQWLFLSFIQHNSYFKTCFHRSMLKSRLHFHFPVLGRGRIYLFTKAAHHCCNLRLINNRITITTYVTTFPMCGTTKKLESDFDVFDLSFWVLREGNWSRNGLLFPLSVVTVPEFFAKVSFSYFHIAADYAPFSP